MQAYIQFDKNNLVAERKMRPRKIVMLSVKYKCRDSSQNSFANVEVLSYQFYMHVSNFTIM